MAIRRIVVTAVTDAAGDATVYSTGIFGYIHTCRYVKTDYTNGVDFTITAEGTGETIWTEANVNSSSTRAPRIANHSTAGVAALYAGSGTAVNDRISLGGDRIKIVIAAGGDTHTGEFHFLVTDV